MGRFFSMTKKDVVIHVGLPKTGTTFLQKNVFSKLNVCYTDTIESSRINTCSVFGVPIVNNKINIISHEHLSGINLPDPDDRFRIADRLAILFPHARILVGVRNKEEWLFSLYKQESRRTGSFRGFNPFKKQFNDEYLNFDKYINYLKKQFNDVYIYHYEDLNNDYRSFCFGICEWIGVDMPHIDNIVYNKSFSISQLELVYPVVCIAKYSYDKFRYVVERHNRGNGRT